jgi:hypothetical protein
MVCGTRDAGEAAVANRWGGEYDAHLECRDHRLLHPVARNRQNCSEHLDDVALPVDAVRAQSMQ